MSISPDTNWQHAASLSRHVGLLSASVLFIASLGCETLRFAADSSFLLGVICLLFGMEYLPWYSNVFLVAVIISLRRGHYRWSIGSAVGATVLALATFGLEEIPRNEAGTIAKVIGYGLGFWLWLATSIVLLITSVICFWCDRKANLGT